MKPINTHLIRGFTFTVPVIVLYSISLAIDQTLIDLGQLPDWIFLAVIPILTASIANSVTPKILLIPALILGYWMNAIGIGFFGGIIGGLILGYLGFLLSVKVNIKHPVLVVVMGYIIVPLIAAAGTFVLMNYMVSIPILWFIDIVEQWVTNIDPTNTVILVGALAFLTVIDLGGPLNKLAFTFVLSFYVDGLYHITGPAIISVAIPPLSMWVLLLVFPKKFSFPSSQGRKLLILGSLFGLTESSIPMILEDPLRRHPFVVLGSVSAAVFAAMFGLENMLLLVSLPGAFGVNKLLIYIIAHVIGIGIVVLFVPIITSDKSLHIQEDTV